MKRLTLLFLLCVLSPGVKAQQVEEITSSEKTLISKISYERLEKRFNARYKNRPAGNFIREDEPKGKNGLDIFPDTLYAGEPFDVHYMQGDTGESVYELYDKRAKRPRKMVTKRLSTLVNGYTVLRITLPEPGEYEVVAWDDVWLMRSRYPEMQKSRWTITVYDR